MKPPFDQAIARTFRQAADFAVTGRDLPAWLEQQIQAVDTLGGGDVTRGLALYIEGLQLERDALAALEAQWKPTP